MSISTPPESSESSGRIRETPRRRNEAYVTAVYLSIGGIAPGHPWFPPSEKRRPDCAGQRQRRTSGSAWPCLRVCFFGPYLQDKSVYFCTEWDMAYSGATSTGNGERIFFSTGTGRSFISNLYFSYVLICFLFEFVNALLQSHGKGHISWQKLAKLQSYRNKLWSRYRAWS